MKLAYILTPILLSAAMNVDGQTDEADLSAYLMVYHKDQDHGLHMAVSEDGYIWTALNDDHPIIAGVLISE